MLLLLDLTKPPQPITSPELALVKSKKDKTHINSMLKKYVILASSENPDKNFTPGLQKNVTTTRQLKCKAI